MLNLLGLKIKWSVQSVKKKKRQLWVCVSPWAKSEWNVEGGKVFLLLILQGFWFDFETKLDFDFNTVSCNHTAQVKLIYLFYDLVYLFYCSYVLLCTAFLSMTAWKMVESLVLQWKKKRHFQMKYKYFKKAIIFGSSAPLSHTNTLSYKS